MAGRTRFFRLKRTVYQKRAGEPLSDTQTNELAHQLRRRFSMDISQLCRVLNLPYEQAAGYFDSF